MVTLTVQADVSLSASRRNDTKRRVLGTWRLARTAHGSTPARPSRGRDHPGRRPGGTVGLASWSPDGSIGQMFGVITRHVPGPPGVASPLLWGTEQHLSGLFGASVADAESVRRTCTWRFTSAEVARNRDARARPQRPGHRAVRRDRPASQGAFVSRCRPDGARRRRRRPGQLGDPPELRRLSRTHRTIGPAGTDGRPY